MSTVYFVLQVTSDRECNQLNDLQRKITETVQRNKEIHELNNLVSGDNSTFGR